MAERNVAVRIQAVGGDKVRAEFTKIHSIGGRALRGIEGSARRSGLAMQNAAFQVQDFFVQVASGTSATRAIAQQLPQLLGSFGLFGALAGTAVAALAPLIGKMFEGAEKAEKLTKTLERMEKSVADAASATKEARVPLAELTKQYGDLADEVDRARRAEAEIKQQRAGADITSVSKGSAQQIIGPAGSFDASLLKEFGVNLDELYAKAEALRDLLASPESNGREAQIEADIEALDEYIVRVRDLRDQYSITVEEAARLVQAANALGEADGAKEQAVAADELKSTLIDVFGSVEAVDAAMPSILDGLNAIVREAGNLSSALGFAADEAARIVAAIDRGERAQNYLKNAKIIGAYQLYADTRMAAPDEPVKHSAPSRRRGGGGGGSSEAQRERNQLTREAERIYDSTRTAVEKYNIEQAKLNDLLKAGYIDQDTYSRALEDLKDRTQDAGMSAREMKSAFGDAFAGIITGATSAREALANLLSTFASSLANSAFNSLWSSIFPGGGLGFGGARAMGGPVSPGSWYLVGENGPEPFVPSVPGTIVPNNALRGGGGGVTINIDARGAQEGVAEQIRRAMDAAVPRILKASTASVADARLRGKRV